MDHSMRILVVGPYPPIRDGIASYAAQHVKALLAQGHDVEVLSPGPSAAHHNLDLLGPRGAAALAKRVRAYDKLVVQFHPDFFYRQPNTWRLRMAESLALLVAFTRAKHVDVVVHEIDYRLGRRSTPDGLAARALWRAVDRVIVHTERERSDFAAAYGVPLSKIELELHGANFVPCTRHDRASARRSLGIESGTFTFLAIGFIQPHKGFDRAIEAFGTLGQRDARLDIVGSVRVEEPEYVSYADDLEARAEQVPGVRVHRGYVSDELFDRWIVASDVVVLPYRSVWSSGVLERASLFGRPVIATSVGGLEGQSAAVGADVVLVSTDAGLRDAMWRVRGGEIPAVADSPWLVDADDGDLRERIQHEVRVRAAALRGPSAAPLTVTGASAPVRRGGQASAPLRRLPAVGRPAETSARPLVGLVKRAIRRLTAWEIDPVVDQVNALRAATVQAVEAAAAANAEPHVTSPAAPKGAGVGDR
jgi:glycosyltransferase involved in cell wall biosynthesis